MITVDDRITYANYALIGLGGLLFIMAIVGSLILLMMTALSSKGMYVQYYVILYIIMYCTIAYVYDNFIGNWTIKLKNCTLLS